MSVSPVSEFRVGGVLGRSISILRRNFGTFGTLALLFTWPLLFVSDDTDIDLDGERLGQPGREAPVFDTGPAEGEIAAVVAIVAVVLLFVMALYMLATSTMVYGTFQDLRGRRVGVGECIRRGLATVIPVIGIAILSTLLIILVSGLLSLPGILIVSGTPVLGVAWIAAAVVVPSLMIYTALWVAVPVAVVERPGVIASMRRSAALTKGYRWRILGVLLVIGLLNGVAEAIATSPFGGSGGAAGGMAETVIGYLVTVFFAAWGAVATAVAYHDLRAVKEGIGVNEIAAVFD